MKMDAVVKLKNYVFFREVDEGVLFESGQNTFVLKGKGIYPIVARVIRFLDTGIEIAGMLRQLPEKVVPFAQRLLEELNRYGMLLNAVAERDLASRYQGQNQVVEFIRFLQDNLDEDYAAAFDRWQQTEVLLLGNGYALKSALGCLVNSGVGTIALCHLGQSHAYPTKAEIDVCVEQRRQQDSNFLCRRLAGENFREYLEVSPGRLTLVCADDIAGVQDELSCDLQFVLRDIPYMVASSAGGCSFVSPLNENGYTNYADLRAWLTTTTPPGPQGEIGQTPAGLALTGALAAYNFIKYSFGIDRVFLRNHCALVSPFLDVDYHPLLPVQNLDRGAPLLSVEYKVPFEVPDGRPVSRYETLLMDLSPAFDRLLGAFSPEPAKKIKQLPLYHDAIQVRFPSSYGLSPQRVHSWGISAEDAGLRTLARALALYAKAQVWRDTALSTGIGTPNDANFYHNSFGVVAAFDHTSWLRQAAAVAVINGTDFPGTASRAYLYADEFNNADIQMLVRILRLYVSEPLRVDLYWREGGGAFAARFTAADGLVGLGYGATPDQAVLECLGDTCSRYQFAELEQVSDIDVVRSFPAAESPLSPSVLRDYTEIHAPQLAITEHILQNIFHTDAYVVGAVTLVRKLT